MNRRETQHGTPSSHARTVETLALEKPMRRRFDHASACGRHPSRSDDVERNALQDDQITPPPRNHVGRTSPRSELDQPVPSVNQHPELRPLAARRCTRRMTGDGGVSQCRVVIAGCRDTVQRLPPREGFFADDEVPGQVLSSTRHRDQDVLIGPIGQSRRQPKVGMHPGEVSPQKPGGSSVHELNRKTVRDPAGGHPDGLPRRKRHQFACRDGRASVGDPEQRKTRGVEIGPLLAQRVLRGPSAADPDDILSGIPHHAHERRGRHTEPLPEDGRREKSTAQFCRHACHETIIQHDNAHNCRTIWPIFSEY